MGAARENKSIWVDFKNKRWSSGITKLKILISPKSHWDKKLIWVDSFKQPFSKAIGCKIWGHNWYEDKWPEGAEYFCKNCYKWENHQEK
jgi:hypothetical protein